MAELLIPAFASQTTSLPSLRPPDQLPVAMGRKNSAKNAKEATQEKAVPEKKGGKQQAQAPAQPAAAKPEPAPKGKGGKKGKK